MSTATLPPVSYTLPLPTGDPDSIVYRRAAARREPVAVTAPRPSRAEWLARDAAERAAAAAERAELERARIPAPAPAEPAAPAAPAELEALPVGFELPALKAYLLAAFPGVAVSAVSSTKVPRGVYVLSHPVELPERTGRRGAYVALCTVHKLGAVCPSRSSANLWRDTAAHWCPRCIGIAN